MTEDEMIQELVRAASDWVDEIGPIERIEGFYSTMQGRGIKLDLSADRLVRAVIALRAHRAGIRS